MALWFGLKERLTALFRRRSVEQEMDEELSFHLDMAVERNLERGMSPAEARRAALAQSTI